MWHTQSLLPDIPFNRAESAVEQLDASRPGLFVPAHTQVAYVFMPIALQKLDIHSNGARASQELVRYRQHSYEDTLKADAT